MNSKHTDEDVYPSWCSVVEDNVRDITALPHGKRKTTGKEVHETH